MTDDPNYSEEVRQNLLREIASMKRQSVFSLIFAILCVIVMVYLFFRLRESNRELTQAKEKLAEQNLTLEEQKLALTNFKNELDAWRMSLLEVDSLPDELAQPEPIMLPEDVALAAEPVLARPTIPKRARRNLPRRPQTSGGSVAETDQAGASAPAVVQAAPEPMVMYQTQAQHYDLNKQQSTAKSLCFGYIIYIQDAKKGEVSTDLQKLLKEKGAIVPAIQSKNLPARYRTTIKYFHPQDEKSAQWVRKLLLDTLKKNRISMAEADVPVTYVANAKVSLGQLEVWIGN